MKMLLALAFGLPLTIPSCLDRAPTVTVTAPATFEKREAGAIIGEHDFFEIYLRVFDGTRGDEILWAIEVEGRMTTLFPIELTPGKDYSFTLVQEQPSVQDSVVGHGFKLPHIVRIEDVYKRWDAHPLYDCSVCDVHIFTMQSELERVTSGC